MVSWNEIPNKFKVSREKVTKKLIEEFYDWRSRYYVRVQGKNVLPLIDKLDKYLSSGKTILDMACGFGFHCFYFSSLGLIPTGVDLSGKHIEICKDEVPLGHFIKGDMVTIKLNMKFNIVTCFDTLEHLFPEEIETAIKNMICHLKRNGILFLSWASPSYLKWRMTIDGRDKVKTNDFRSCGYAGYQPTDFLVEKKRVMKLLKEKNMVILDGGKTRMRIWILAQKGVENG